MIIQTVGKDAKLKMTPCSDSDLPGWWRFEIDNGDHSATVLVCPSRMRELVGDLMKDRELRSAASQPPRRTVGVLG